MMLVVLALVAAVVIGGLAALTITPAVGLGVALLTLAAGVAGQATDGPPRRAIGITLLATILVAGSYLAVTVSDLVEEEAATAAVPTADPALVDDAAAELDEAEPSGAFRLEWTEPELEAVIQDGIDRDPQAPVSAIELDLRGATQDVAYIATLKGIPVKARGTAQVVVTDGRVGLDLGPMSVGPLSLDGAATGAVESAIEGMTELNDALTAQGTVVEDVQITDDRLIVTGVS